MKAPQRSPHQSQPAIVLPDATPTDAPPAGSWSADAAAAGPDGVPGPLSTGAPGAPARPTVVISHPVRARRGASPALQLVLVIVLLAAAASALTVAWRDVPVRRELRTAADQSALTARAPAGSSVPAGTAATPTAVPSGATPTASPTASTAPGTGTPPAAPGLAETGPDRSVPVVVRNGTHTTGLAAAVAAQLRRAGWKVIEVGNQRPVVGATKVLAVGHDAATQTLQRDLGRGYPTASPASSATAGRIVLVLGPDYRKR
ncbi:MAG: hypothetical protein EPO13_02905 [Actinomycetota bacterium]|nr:MAG: hypothetical protein EPO13_02905 [Actinomycetota bacterium]